MSSAINQQTWTRKSPARAQASAKHQLVYLHSSNLQMSAPDTSDGHGSLPPPGQEPLTADQIYTPPPMAGLSRPGKRLYWTLQGPLSASIFVMPEDLNPDAPREAYFRQTLAGTTWHPIATEAVTEQPVASLTVGEEHLSDWQDEWWTINMEGFDDDVEPAPEDVPPKFEPLVVTASEEFVTVHDFVSAVHPWLMGLRQQILRAKNVADEDYMPSADARLLVAADRPELVRVEDEQEWLGTLRWCFEENRRRQQGTTG